MCHFERVTPSAVEERDTTHGLIKNGNKFAR